VARLVRIEGKGPIPVGDPPVYVCGCGLTKAFPYCTGAHIHVADEEPGETYVYDSGGNRLGPVAGVRLRGGDVIGPEGLYTPKPKP